MRKRGGLIMWLGLPNYTLMVIRLCMGGDMGVGEGIFTLLLLPTHWGTTQEVTSLLVPLPPPRPSVQRQGVALLLLSVLPSMAPKKWCTTFRVAQFLHLLNLPVVKYSCKWSLHNEKRDLSVSTQHLRTLEYKAAWCQNSLGQYLGLS